MKTKLNVGLIGAGRIGRVHAENLAYRIPEANVVAVADVVFDSAKTCAAEFQIPTALSDPQVMLDDDAVDAVVICASTDTHAPLIMAAAQAGKHIDGNAADAARRAINGNRAKLGALAVLLHSMNRQSCRKTGSTERHRLSQIEPVRQRRGPFSRHSCVFTEAAIMGFAQSAAVDDDRRAFGYSFISR